MPIDTYQCERCKAVTKRFRVAGAPFDIEPTCDQPGCCGTMELVIGQLEVAKKKCSTKKGK